MINKFYKYSIRIGLSIVVFIIFLNTMPFVANVNSFVDQLYFYDSKTLVIGEASVIVEIADTERKLIKGLSYRKNLDEDKGMWFVFEKDGLHGFWMKDTNFPLDMIWVNKHYEIVHIEKNVHPNSYPKVFSSSVESRFVLEVNAGFSDRNNIKLGDLVHML